MNIYCIIIYSNLHISYDIHIYFEIFPESWVIFILHSFAYIRLQNANWQAVMSATSESKLKCKVQKMFL